MDIPQRMSDRRMQDLNTVQPNMESYQASQTTRDVHNHAPELANAPMKRKATAIVNPSNPISVDAIIK